MLRLAAAESEASVSAGRIGEALGTDSGACEACGLRGACSVGAGDGGAGLGGAAGRRHEREPPSRAEEGRAIPSRRGGGGRARAEPKDAEGAAAPPSPARSRARRSARARQDAPPSPTTGGGRMRSESGGASVAPAPRRTIPAGGVGAAAGGELAAPDSACSDGFAVGAPRRAIVIHSMPPARASRSRWRLGRVVGGASPPSTSAPSPAAPSLRSAWLRRLFVRSSSPPPSSRWRWRCFRWRCFRWRCRSAPSSSPPPPPSSSRSATPPSMVLRLCRACWENLCSPSALRGKAQKLS